MRYSVPCPACGASTRFVIVRGEVQTSCRRCDVRAVVLRACCEGAPKPDELTGDASETCVCGEERRLRTGSIRAPLALAKENAREVPEPRWRPLVLREHRGRGPYRSEGQTALTLERPPVGAPQLAMVSAGLGWPAVPLLVMVSPVQALVWLTFAFCMAALLVYGARPVQRLEADVEGVRVRHGGMRSRERGTRSNQIRRVFWAGRGARCAVWAQTDEGHELLFDGLGPDQAASLERKLEHVFQLDRA